MSLSSLASRDVSDRRTADAAKGAAPPAADDRFEALTRYIPTETITLFVAAMSVQPMLAALWPPLGPWVLYWAFAVLTPALQLLLIWLKQREAEGKDATPAPFRPHPWPVIAGLIAYLVWALSVPATGFVEGEAAKAVGAVGALFISSVLSVGDRIAEIA